MRKIANTAILALLSLPIASQARAQGAEALIERAASAYSRLNSMRADFRQTITNPLTGTNVSTSGQILRKKPGLLSISFDTGDRIVADGSMIWVYLPSSMPGQVMRMPSRGMNAGIIDPASQFLDSPRTRYTVTSAGEAVLSGRPAHAVMLVPKRPVQAFTRAKVWIDDRDFSIRQFEVADANGLKRLVVVTRLVANPTLSRSAFSFTPPRGARIVDQSSMGALAN